MMGNIAVGQKVFFEMDGIFRTDNSIEVVSGVVVDIKQQVLTNPSESSNIFPLRVRTGVVIEFIHPYKKVKCIVTKSPIFLFESREDCLRQIAIDAGMIDIRDVYRDQIRSVKDLMRFIFTNGIDPCNRDAAYDVALEKSIELLGYNAFDLIPGAIEV